MRQTDLFRTCLIILIRPEHALLRILIHVNTAKLVSFYNRILDSAIGASFGEAMKERDLSQRISRSDRLIREQVHDPYKTRMKLSEPTVCPQCGAVFVNAKWQWIDRPDGALETLCQACHRINDNYPAGVLTLKGAFVERHKAEVLHLARNQEEREKQTNPLHRIMEIEQREDGIVINTSDIQLPRRIGQALYRAYEGDLEFHYDEEAYFIRASWRRED